MGLLEDDGEDDTFVNTDGGGGVADGDVDTANIVPGGTGVDHVLLVAAEDGSPGQPVAHGREVLPATVVFAASTRLELDGGSEDGRQSSQGGDHHSLESHCIG